MSGDNRQGPWGRDQRPPEIEELLEKLQEQFRTFFGSNKFSSWLIIIVILIAYGGTGFYQVNQDEVGVVQLLGEYKETKGPGLGWRARGIQKVTKVPVEAENVEEFGMRTLRAGVRTEYAPAKRYESESLMLTGDLNCVLVPWVVRYRIGDPYKYLFRVRAVKDTLRQLAEATMRTIIGDYSLDEVLMKREFIATQAQIALQEALDAAECGLFITTIELGKTNVPEPVQPSFNEVNEAGQEKEKLIYQAQGAYNKVIPEARGKAEKQIQEAEGYAVDRVKRSQGDVNRFLALYTEYAKAKKITRQRLYLEAMQEMLPRLGNKYIIDSNQKGFLPLLQLGEKGDKQ